MSDVTSMVAAATRPAEHSMPSRAGLRTDTWTVVFLAAIVTGGAGAVAFIGADARWLAALGRIIANRGVIPSGVPFAAAPTAHWPNAIALAELTFYGLQSTLGERGLMIAQLIAITVAVVVLTRDALADGATREGTAAALLLAALGALESLVVTRVQLFSLALLPLLIALLRSEFRAPSARIWLVLPLLAVWSNLHGAVLVGAGVTFVYLALARSRAQPRVAAGVALGALVSLCATPAGLRTPSYYYGVLTNEAAKYGQGLWAPLSLRSPLDVLLIVATIGLVIGLYRARPAIWELMVIVALAGLTVHASRSGVWLLFFLVAPAAKGFRSRKLWGSLLPALATVGLVGLAVAVVRGPLPSGASSAVVSRAIKFADGTPVLAEDVLAEQVALAGGRVWVSNPIDAFSKAVQRRYLDWDAGSSRGTHELAPQIRVALTARGSAAQKLMARQPGWAEVDADQTSEIYLRSS